MYTMKQASSQWVTFTSCIQYTEALCISANCCFEDLSVTYML